MAERVGFEPSQTFYYQRTVDHKKPIVPRLHNPQGCLSDVVRWWLETLCISLLCDGAHLVRGRASCNFLTKAAKHHNSGNFASEEAEVAEATKQVLAQGSR